MRKIRKHRCGLCNKNIATWERESKFNSDSQYFTYYCDDCFDEKLSESYLHNENGFRVLNNIPTKYVTYQEILSVLRKFPFIDGNKISERIMINSLKRKAISLCKETPKGLAVPYNIFMSSMGNDVKKLIKEESNLIEIIRAVKFLTFFKQNLSQFKKSFF